MKSFLKKLFRSKTPVAERSNQYEAIQRLLKPHAILGILDAGASTGRFSRRFSHMFPKAEIHAFEPNALYENALKELSAENPRIHPEFKALSDQPGEAELVMTHSPGTTSLFKPSRRLETAFPEESSVETIKRVPVVTIDEWAKSNGIASIELMKFDIQGGELKALRGAATMLQHQTLLVYTEVLFNRLYDGGAVYSEIDLWLRECGFVLYDLLKPKYDKSGCLMWGNAIFLHEKRMKV